MLIFAWLCRIDSSRCSAYHAYCRFSLSVSSTHLQDICMYCDFYSNFKDFIHLKLWVGE